VPRRTGGRKLRCAICYCTRIFSDIPLEGGSVLSMEHSFEGFPACSAPPFSFFLSLSAQAITAFLVLHGTPGPAHEVLPLALILAIPFAFYPASIASYGFSRSGLSETCPPPMVQIPLLSPMTFRIDRRVLTLSVVSFLVCSRGKLRLLGILPVFLLLSAAAPERPSFAT